MGLTAIDTGVLIGFLERNDPHHQSTRRMLGELRQAGETLALPISAYAEALVGPLRLGVEAEQYRTVVHGFPMQLIPVDESIAEATARLRAVHGSRLRLPDALVVATAQVIEADTLITTDHRWPDAEVLGFEGELIVL